MDIIGSMLDAIRGKKKKKVKDTGGAKQEESGNSVQPGSLYRKGGRKRQLDEMEG